MTFYGENGVVIHVRLGDVLNTQKPLKVTVDLGPLPDMSAPGHEVVVEFRAENFTNNGTFWTDSNGLEMQKRILNYRPTWNVSLNYNDSL